MENLSSRDLISTLQESVRGNEQQERLSQEIRSYCDIGGSFDRGKCEELLDVVQQELPENSKNYEKLKAYFNKTELLQVQEKITTNALVSDFSYIDVSKINLDGDTLNVSKLNEDERRIIETLELKGFDIKKAIGNQFDTTKSSSGFSAVVLENPKTGEKFFSIRGTDEWMGKDLFSIISLILGKPPKGQIQDMKDFYTKNAGGDMSVVGHSLGGCLSQILRATEGKTGINSVFTYNAPGVEGILQEVYDMKMAGADFDSLGLIDPWKDYPKLASYIDSSCSPIQNADFKESEYNNVYNFVGEDGPKLATSEFIFGRRIGFEFKIPGSSKHEIGEFRKDLLSVGFETTEKIVQNINKKRGKEGQKMFNT